MLKAFLMPTRRLKRFHLKIMHGWSLSGDFEYKKFPVLYFTIWAFTSLFKWDFVERFQRIYTQLLSFYDQPCQFETYTSMVKHFHVLKLKTFESFFA